MDWTGFIRNIFIYKYTYEHSSSEKRVHGFEGEHGRVYRKVSRARFKRRNAIIIISKITTKIITENDN